MNRPGNVSGNLIVQQMLADYITEQMVPYRGQKRPGCSHYRILQGILPLINRSETDHRSTG